MVLASDSLEDTRSKSQKSTLRHLHPSKSEGGWVGGGREGGGDFHIQAGGRYGGDAGVHDVGVPPQQVLHLDEHLRGHVSLAQLQEPQQPLHNARRVLHLRLFSRWWDLRTRS